MARNPIETAEALQSIPQRTLDEYLRGVRNPPPGIPRYQIAAELARRVDMARRYAALSAQQATNEQTGTVVQDAMRLLNPGSVNPSPAGPSQLAARRVPSDLTGPNAPTTPPPLAPPSPMTTPPINAGIASEMPQQLAFSPQAMAAAQPMQAAGGTMGRTVYAKHGSKGEGVYTTGTAALIQALKKTKRNYAAGRPPFEREGSPYKTSPEEPLPLAVRLAQIAKTREPLARGGFAPNYQTQFAADGTQGRTVYAQFGYPPEEVPAPSSARPALTRAELDQARKMGATSIEEFDARQAGELEKADKLYADLLRKYRRALPRVKYPAFHGSSGRELLDKQSTKAEMRRLGIAPGPSAVVQLSDAQQREAAALEAANYLRASKPSAEPSTPPPMQMTAEEVRRANLGDEEAGRMTIEEPVDEEIGRPSLTPHEIRVDRAEAVEAEDAVRATEVRLTDRSGRPIMPPEGAFQYLDEQPDIMVRPHVDRVINDYFAGLPVDIHEENIEIKREFLKRLEKMWEGEESAQSVLQKFEAAKGGILKSAENYSARMAKAFRENVGPASPQVLEAPLNKVRLLNRESSPGSVVNSLQDTQIAGLGGLEIAADPRIPKDDPLARGPERAASRRQRSEFDVNIPGYVEPAGDGDSGVLTTDARGDPRRDTVPKNGILSEVKEPPVSIRPPDFDEGFAIGMAPVDLIQRGVSEPGAAAVDAAIADDPAGRGGSEAAAKYDYEVYFNAVKKSMGIVTDLSDAADVVAIDNKRTEKETATKDYFDKMYADLEANTSNTKEHLQKLEDMHTALTDFSETGKLPKDKKYALITEWLLQTAAGFLDPYDKEGRLKSFAEHVGESFKAYADIATEHKKQYLDGLKESFDSQKSISNMHITINNAAQSAKQSLILAHAAAKRGDEQVAAAWQANALKKLQIIETSKANLRRDMIGLMNAHSTMEAAKAATLTAGKESATGLRARRILEIQTSTLEEAFALQAQDPAAGNAMLEQYFIIDANGIVKMDDKGRPMVKESAFAAVYAKFPELRASGAYGGFSVGQERTGRKDLSKFISELEASWGRTQGLDAENWNEPAGRRARLVMDKIYPGWKAGDPIDKALFEKTYLETHHSAQINKPGMLLYDAYQAVKGAGGQQGELSEADREAMEKISPLTN